MTDQIDMFGEASEVPVDNTGHSTARELRAIKNFCDKGYRCSATNNYPTYHFTNVLTGLETSRPIQELLAQYDADRRVAARERAEARRRGLPS